MRICRCCTEPATLGKYCDTCRDIPRIRLPETQKKRNYSGRTNKYPLQNDPKWWELRNRFIKANRLCARHLCQNKYIAATEVDHIAPVSYAFELRYEESNLQSLCKHCHRIKTNAEKNAKVAYDYNTQTKILLEERQ